MGYRVDWRKMPARAWVTGPVGACTAAPEWPLEGDVLDEVAPGLGLEGDAGRVGGSAPEHGLEGDDGGVDEEAPELELEGAVDAACAEARRRVIRLKRIYNF
jgi:hypothetical protein